MALPEEAMQKDPATGRLRGHDMPAAAPPSAPSTPDYSGFTPEAAKAELKRLAGDPSYREKLMRNDALTLQTKRALDARAVGMDPAEAQKLLARDPDAVGRANAKEQADAQAALDAHRAENTPKGQAEYTAVMRDAPLPRGMELVPEQLEVLSQVAEAEGLDRREAQQMIVIASVVAQVEATEIPIERYADQQRARLANWYGADLDAKVAVAQAELNRLAVTHPGFVKGLSNHALTIAEGVRMLIELGERRARAQR